MADAVIVYKIVDANGQSIVAQYTNNPEWVCQYEIGLTTTPRRPEAKLFAFSSLEEAKDYRGEFDRYFQILRCEATGVQPHDGRPMPYGDSIKSDWVLFWDGGGEYRYATQIPPSGTVWCDSITPLERMA